MAVTSTMLALGTEAPDFSLPDVVSGGTVSLSDFDDKTGVLVMFICNHCPYVQHVRHELAAIGKDYADSGIGIVAICSNDPEVSPGDSPERMRDEAHEQGYVFPYLFDETQEVAAAYTAMCTPDFFLFGHDRKLVYRGRMDEARPGNEVPVTGDELRAAMDAVIAGEPSPANSTPPWVAPSNGPRADNPPTSVEPPTSANPGYLEPYMTQIRSSSRKKADDQAI